LVSASFGLNSKKGMQTVVSNVVQVVISVDPVVVSVRSVVDVGLEVVEELGSLVGSWVPRVVVGSVSDVVSKGSEVTVEDVIPVVLASVFGDVWDSVVISLVVISVF
jgi:hypothetical protein